MDGHRSRVRRRRRDHRQHDLSPHHPHADDAFNAVAIHLDKQINVLDRFISKQTKILSIQLLIYTTNMTTQSFQPIAKQSRTQQR